jgi:hypothetical protein
MKHLTFKFFALMAIFFLAVCTLGLAQNPATQEPALVKLPAWMSTNWSIVALFVSEAMAFLPQKFSGIARSVFSVVAAVFGKKASGLK